MRKKPFTVNLDDAQVEALQRLADEHDVSASDLTRRAVKFLLSNPALFLPPVHSTAMQK